MRAVTTIFAALLTGCAATGGIAPQARLVDVKALDTGMPLPATASEPARPWPHGQWWGVFGDSQLDALVERAMHGSPDLRVALARVRQAESAAGVARAQTRLTAGIDGEFTRYHFTEHEFIPPPYAGNDYWDNKILLETGYDLDLWGRDNSALEAALDSVHAAQAQSRAAQLSLQTAVVRAYLQLALDYALLDVAQSTLDQQQQILDITRSRMAAGLGTQLEVSEALTPLPGTRADIERLEASIALGRNRISALCGQGPGAAASIARPRLDLARVPALPESIPAHWIGERPDVVAARWRVEAASKDIAVAKARFYPDINIKGLAGFQSLDFGRLLQGDSVLTGFGPAITLPLFTGGRLRAQLGASTAAYDAAVESYNGQVIGALQQVADRLVSVRSLDVQLDQTRQGVDAAQKAYDLALAGYKAGLIEYLSVLNTQSHLLDAQRRIQQLRAQRLDALAVLIDALGGTPMTPGP